MRQGNFRSHNRHTRPISLPTVPDISTVSATSKGYYPIANLSHSAKEAHVFKNLHSSSLISLGQLYDNDCLVLLNKYILAAFKNNRLILNGIRNKSDGLWDIILHQATNDTLMHKANVIVKKSTTKRDLIHFFHGACFSPAKSTRLQAIKNRNFDTWPGFTYAATSKFLSMTIPTALGHLQQEGKNLHSTKPPPLEDDFFPTQKQSNTKTHNAFVSLTPFKVANKAYGDLTGRFPYISARGNQYFLTVYDYDNNAILVETLKSRTATDIHPLT